ncbi:GRF zinc finger motif [Mollivirus sibericum]|uniref:GRF zinc finger motif n=1 Tax=Mollivirus sibericum TaxID=1678078 RepID=UPI0006B2DCF5|nr:GRF zinc finger motif [Mollivirus sibericum]ALD62213.1 GRF zinc finger motif [Mollivirus sibericum]
MEHDGMDQDYFDRLFTEVQASCSSPRPKHVSLFRGLLPAPTESQQPWQQRQQQQQTYAVRHNPTSQRAANPDQPERVPDICCECSDGFEAAFVQVKKEGQNQGRWFYTCGRRTPGTRCKFFKFHDAALESAFDRLAPQQRDVLVHEAAYLGQCDLRPALLAMDLLDDAIDHGLLTFDEVSLWYKGYKSLCDMATKRKEPVPGQDPAAAAVAVVKKEQSKPSAATKVGMRLPSPPLPVSQLPEGMIQPMPAAFEKWPPPPLDPPRSLLPMTVTTTSLAIASVALAFRTKGWLVYTASPFEMTTQRVCLSLNQAPPYGQRQRLWMEPPARFPPSPHLSATLDSSLGTTPCYWLQVRAPSSLGKTPGESLESEADMILLERLSVDASTGAAQGTGTFAVVRQRLLRRFVDSVINATSEADCPEELSALVQRNRPLRMSKHLYHPSERYVLIDADLLETYVDPDCASVPALVTLIDLPGRIKEAYLKSSEQVMTLSRQASSSTQLTKVVRSSMASVVFKQNLDEDETDDPRDDTSLLKPKTETQDDDVMVVVQL